MSQRVRFKPGFVERRPETQEQLTMRSNHAATPKKFCR
jgi:hypothetical protein